MKTPRPAFTIHTLESPFLEERLQRKINEKTKPLGSLGKLESLAFQIGCILQTDQPILKKPQLLLFAGDHGLAAQGVSAYPSAVTWQMVLNFLNEGAAASVFTRQHQIALKIIDCGVNYDFSPHPHLLNYKLGKGTKDSSIQPAMTLKTCTLAIENGREIIKTLPGNSLLLGEMGIGNSSAASLLMSRLIDLPIEKCVGAGTGLNETQIQRKKLVLKMVLERHSPSKDPLTTLAALGGFEIATMVGAILQAAEENRVILVDGFITTAAVLCAYHLYPYILQRCIFSHCSHEKPHATLLKFLDVSPLLHLDMRLGEGSGAAIAWPILQSSCRFLCEMASFESAAVSTKSR